MANSNATQQKSLFLSVSTLNTECRKGEYDYRLKWVSIEGFNKQVVCKKSAESTFINDTKLRSLKI